MNEEKMIKQMLIHFPQIEIEKYIYNLQQENEKLRQKIDKTREYIEIIDNRDYVDISEVRYIYKILGGDNND